VCVVEIILFLFSVLLQVLSQQEKEKGNDEEEGIKLIEIEKKKKILRCCEDKRSFSEVFFISFLLLFF
jgi:hypothetical protein